MENKDRVFLARAVELAIAGMKKGGGPFGAVIVNTGRVVSEAFNKVVISHDPTAHAEVLAIREASVKLNTHDLSECILYTSCEPCPMCLGAIYWSGIKKVFYACDRNDAAMAGFDDRLIYNEIALDPSARRISFIRLDDAGATEIFKTWDNLEDKTLY